jgi:hypothetical protein
VPTLQAGRWFGYSFALLCGVLHLYQIMRTFKRVLLWRAGLSPYQQDVTSPLMGLPPSCDSNSSQARAAANDTRVTAKIFLEIQALEVCHCQKAKLAAAATLTS